MYVNTLYQTSVNQEEIEVEMIVLINSKLATD